MAWQDNAFFKPNFNYGYQGNNQIDGDYYNTPQQISFQEPGQPKGTFLRWLTNQNAAGFGRRDLFAQSMFNRATQGYEAASQSNPDLTFRKYLDQLGSGFVDNIWAGLTPEQRGETPQKYASPVRWMSRG